MDDIRSVSRTTTIAALILIALATDALAQSDTFYDASEKSVGGSFTDGKGTPAVLGDAGRAAGRTETNSDGTATVYDSSGRVIGYEITTTGSALIDEAEGPIVYRFPRSR